MWGTVIGCGFVVTGIFSFALSPLATLTKLYLLFFSIITITIESEGETVSSNLKAFIFQQCAALEYTRPRGLFYMYIGVTGILGGKMTKRRLLGWYFFLCGLLHVILYQVTIAYIRDLSTVFRDDADLVTKFNAHANGKGWLDVSIASSNLGCLAHDPTDDG